MKSFALAVLATLVNANYVSKADAVPASAHANIATIGGNIEFWYENKTLKVKAYTKTALTLALGADSDILESAVFIPYSPTSGTPTKWYALMCKITNSNTETKYTPTWLVYDHTTAMIAHATDELTTVNGLGTTTLLSMAGNDVAKGIKVIDAPNQPLATVSGITFDWGASDTFVELDTDAKIF